jgi:hypothetical protein
VTRNPLTIAFIAAINNFMLNNLGTVYIFYFSASSHMSSNMNFLSAGFPFPYLKTITIGDGSSITISAPVTLLFKVLMPNFYYAMFLLPRN